MLLDLDFCNIRVLERERKEKEVKLKITPVCIQFN